MKDIDPILKALDEQQWRVVRAGSGHYKAYPPDSTKPMVTMPATPSDNRAIANTISRLKKSGFIWPWNPKRKG